MNTTLALLCILVLELVSDLFSQAESVPLHVYEEVPI